jgi:predicted DNA-binding transcriptional regulator YafY
MSDLEIIKNVVAALRDTAAKAAEKTRTVTKEHDYQSYGREKEVTYETDTYSRDWIAGRILGMADMIDALLPREVAP